jgi:hypothetical protein
MFVGRADPRIDNNNKVPNPNVTVFEWLNRRPHLHDRVAAFGSWDVLPSILNADRSRIPVGSGWTVVPNATTDSERAINQLAKICHATGRTVLSTRRSSTRRSRRYARASLARFT